MKQRVKASPIAVVLALLMALPSMLQAADMYRALEKFARDSQMHQQEFENRVRDTCEQLRAECEKKSIAVGSEITLQAAVPLYRRQGYRFIRDGQLPADTPVTIKGSLKGYYKVKPAGKIRFLAIADFTRNYASPCTATDSPCFENRGEREKP